jgi:8-oxo-dGTP pyrophosphatase MutT (NUDIX family)
MTHVHEKIDFTVTVYIVHDGKVLLRRHDKYNFWLGAGGHIDLNEDPNQAALREVKEEVGLEVVLWDGNKKLNAAPDDLHQELVPPVAMNRHRISPTHEHVDMVYFAAAPSDDVQVEYEDDRSNEWRWLAKDELNSLELLPDVKFYAALALDTLGKK